MAWVLGGAVVVASEALVRCLEAALRCENQRLLQGLLAEEGLCLKL